MSLSSCSRHVRDQLRVCVVWNANNQHAWCNILKVAVDTDAQTSTKSRMIFTERWHVMLTMQRPVLTNVKTCQRGLRKKRMISLSKSGAEMEIGEKADQRCSQQVEVYDTVTCTFQRHITQLLDLVVLGSSQLVLTTDASSFDKVLTATTYMFQRCCAPMRKNLR